MEKIKIVKLTKIFGPHPEKALQLLAEGESKDDIFNKTGQVIALTDVSFEIPEGEILVVMGLSGSGKSTLIRCINRLIDPSFGQIFIDGIDITTLDHHALLELRRHKFGMVFQNFALFPHRCILNNVEYGLEIQQIDKALRQEKAKETIKLVGLEGWEEAMPSQLSGGMQQRVGLARALAIDPDILLMDEAFSALDPLIRNDMQNELMSLQARMKKPFFLLLTT
ncbi:Glycine betaine/L-proline transport ATP-binding subunit [Beggiatoa sp. PS]|nr:Glycine betaine/L-proline transport ATP-binding subunit [Beggiatoa sp. PS]